MVTIEDVADLLKAKSAHVAAFGKTIKLVLDNQVVMVNGCQDPVTIDIADSTADITVTATLDDFHKVLTKKINPQLALMTRKLTTQGDMLALVPLIKFL